MKMFIQKHVHINLPHTVPYRLSMSMALEGSNQFRKYMIAVIFITFTLVLSWFIYDSMIIVFSKEHLKRIENVAVVQMMRRL